MNIKEALAQMVTGASLEKSQMVEVMRHIMKGECHPAQVGAFLVALRMKGETVDEVTGAVSVMRELASAVSVDDPYAVDIVGTGGDGANLFNVSTASAFVVAAAGGSVAKHGNRAVSSSTGSADALEAAGVNLQLSSEQVASCVKELGVGFMFAPLHHSAMKHAIEVRKALSMRTIFNILGPMTNPAGVGRQVIGVFDRQVAELVAKVMQQLKSEHILVVHSEDGLDELSLAGKSWVTELKDGQITEYSVSPDQFGLEIQPINDLVVESAEQSMALIKDALGKQETKAGQKAADMIALNAGAAIYTAGLADTLNAGVHMASDAIYSGLAKQKLTELVSFSNYLADQTSA